MGCDIHARIERRNDLGHRAEWLDSGDPDVGRNYEMFAVLAGVRNRTGVTPVAEPRGIPGCSGRSDKGDWLTWHGEGERPNFDFCACYERWYDDAHSASWLTLAEIKAFDTTQTVDDPAFIVGRKGGKVTATAGWTSGPHEGPVGERRILTWPGENEPVAWLRLIRYMEQAKWDGQTDDEIRLVFFFDN